MQLSVFAVAGLVALAMADPCMVQVGGASGASCAYSTSDCMSGTIQWNYPAHDCQWTFSPPGASELKLTASWATAKHVDVVFLDGTEPTATAIGFVKGEGERAHIDLTSSTGVIHVKLHGPSAMRSGALVFNYELTKLPKKMECSFFKDDCHKCLAAGCSMIGSSCTDTCLYDVPCYKKTADVGIDVTCATHRKQTARYSLCRSQTDCASCLSAECTWLEPGNYCIDECTRFMRCDGAATTCAVVVEEEGRRGDSQKKRMRFGD